MATDTGTNAVNVTEVLDTVVVDNMSMIELFMQADLVIKSVMLLLVLASVWCWAIIFDKWSKFKSNRKKIMSFEKAYRSTKTFGPLYERLKRRQDNPMAAMFVVGMHELNNGLLKGKLVSSREIKEDAKERVYYSVQRVKNIAIEKMQKDLIFLATIGSSAPFIGLFGTVWGIVNSFQAIAASKNTTLAVVAPGIAEALLATAIGLFAAIPAVIFYNIFSNDIRQFADKFEEFSSELSVLLTHHHIRPEREEV